MDGDITVNDLKMQLASLLQVILQLLQVVTRLEVEAGEPSEYYDNYYGAGNYSIGGE